MIKITCEKCSSDRVKFYGRKKIKCRDCGHIDLLERIAEVLEAKESYKWFQSETLRLGSE
jgi:hypothetical protein